MNLSIKEILVNGSRLVFAHRKFVLLFWITNIVFAFALSLPLFSVLQHGLANSLINSNLSLGFDYLWYVQFRHIYRNSLDAIPILLYAFAGVYVLVQLFYLGGLLSVYTNSKKNHVVDFFYGSVKYFIRFLKIAVVVGALYFAAISINVLIDYGIKQIFLEKENAAVEFAVQIFRYLFFLLLISIINIISDYTKIAIVVIDSTKLFRSLYKSFQFIKKNFVKVMTVYFIMLVFVAIGATIYNVVDSFLPKKPVYFLLLTFLIQQLLIIFRVLIRMYFYSTELLIFTDGEAQTVSPAFEEIS
ncbi:MAG: hypothetical protein COT22_09930 [Ignavibacteria bacterium CG08_land_8_20_14_0_20_37_9]|nr:MAG: hypothetical protein AUJ54_01015 [Ignavibacteria bacterium CG1_02_37_35]PIS44552.1 MAG: hypothetical protein COT22_09930 [Ignavibacteria bacterium CG08_land_8_20_14_0_20_37_9]PIX94003.1 MAG: hypothetical protein COZ25_07780 [Ignavibacteria bacterium CG_4_10_14_3_um_filter_37_18]PJC57801.1 MAG: hypothetical protein CO025_11505 [Ignavibacteria bacterium CG_4_9_14_0_2_um_filter_37_13]